MRDRDLLEDLPEAVPLHRVAPLWRLLAICGFIGGAFLLLVILILGIALVNLQKPTITYTNPAPGFAPVVPAAVARAAASPDDDPTLTAQNLPYPLKADLAESQEPTAANQPSPAKPAASARERFLDLGTDLWKLKEPVPHQVVISPDGQSLAYIVQGTLTAGPIGSQRQVVGTVQQPMPLPVRPRKGNQLAYALPMVTFTEANVSLLGPPAWSPDNRFVYCANASGHLRRYDLQSGRSDGFAEAQVLPFEGESPAILPTDPDKLIFVRSLPRPKPAVPGTPATPDVTEVVLGDLASKEVRVLVPASASVWQQLAVSPDGKRLALVSDRGHEGESSSSLRVFVVDLAGGDAKPLTAPAAQVGPLCWTVDGQCLVYARSQDPLPADYWENEPAGPNGMLDLYQWDFTTNREVRLSRGAGCFSPSVSGNDDLNYLAVPTAGSGLFLRRVPLAAAREFASREPPIVVRDGAAWTRLVEQVGEASKVATDADGTALTPEIITQIVDTFNKRYRDLFRAEPPSTLKRFDGQRRELQKLHLSPDVYRKLALLLAVLEGDHLVRDHRARWQLTKGPLVPPDKAGDSVVETPFVYVANPFASVNDTAPRNDSLGTLRQRAEGRTLILANDPAIGRGVAAEATDPDLGRAVELLQEGKAEKAEELFESLVKRHPQNLYLALHIGKRLYEGKRLAALQHLMERQCEILPCDARKFNLLGLALLESEPRQASDAFKNALRCDVHFGPAYLNLAQAYQLANDLHAAGLCLQRYLGLMPNGVYAADARRRLATLDINGK